MKMPMDNNMEALVVLSIMYNIEETDAATKEIIKDEYLKEVKKNKVYLELKDVMDNTLFYEGGVSKLENCFELKSRIERIGTPEDFYEIIERIKGLLKTINIEKMTIYSPVGDIDLFLSEKAEVIDSSTEKREIEYYLKLIRANIFNSITRSQVIGNCSMHYSSALEAQKAYKALLKSKNDFSKHWVIERSKNRIGYFEYSYKQVDAITEIIVNNKFIRCGERYTWRLANDNEHEPIVLCGIGKITNIEFSDIIELDLNRIVSQVSFEENMSVDGIEDSSDYINMLEQYVQAPFTVMPVDLVDFLNNYELNKRYKYSVKENRCVLCGNSSNRGRICKKHFSYR